MNAQPPGGSGHDDDLDPSDWLTSQFDPTGELPKQAPGDGSAVPGQPVAPVPPAAPAAPVQPVQPVQPVAPPQFPVQPGTPMQARSPQQTGQPQPGQPQPEPQFPAAQPQQQPAAPPPAAQEPAAPQQPGGFSWGLTPAAQQPPAAIPPPSTPPAATPPAATPPAATPPGATPPAGAPAAPAPSAASGTWFEPAQPAQSPAAGPQPPAQQPQFPAGQPPHPAPPQQSAAQQSAAQQPAPPQQPAHPHDPAPLDAGLEGTPREGQPPSAPMPFETGILPDVAPDSRDAPPFWEPEPTQMMDALELEPDPRPEQAPKQPFTRSVFPEGTELLAEQPGQPAQPAQPAFGAPAGETGAISALDALFGESQFKEYEAGIADASENPFVRREAVDTGVPGEPGARPPGPPPGVSRLQKILLTVLGSMLAILALVGLFFLGIRLPSIFGPAPAVTAPSASPSPSASAAIVLGPVAPGTYRFDELLGGECLDPYESPWQDEYTVVDCANPHPAQMVRRGEVPEDPETLGVYPGEDVLQAQVLNLCRATGIFSSASGAITDGVVSASYPTAADWDEGSRTYYCFVTRSSGDPITGDITLPQVAPTPSATPAG